MTYLLSLRPVQGLLLLTLLASCTSTAYIRHKSPSISGTMSIAGEPARGIAVYLSLKGDDKQCLQFSQKTSTGLQGEFNFTSAKDHMSYTPLMTYYLDEWSVCAEIDGQRVMLYSDNRYGMGSVSGAVNLRCRFEQGQYSAKNCKKSQ